MADITHKLLATDYFSADLFATETVGLIVEEAEVGRAVVSLNVEPKHRNGKHTVMGGVLMTMADFACAIADYLPDEMNTTVDGGLQFLAPATRDKLVCTATASRRGNTMGFYHAEIRDETDKLLAAGQYTLMHKKK